MYGPEQVMSRQQFSRMIRHLGFAHLPSSSSSFPTSSSSSLLKCIEFRKSGGGNGLGGGNVLGGGSGGGSGGGGSGRGNKKLIRKIRFYQIT